jgi:hypothetical protein
MSKDTKNYFFVYEVMGAFGPNQGGCGVLEASGLITNDDIPTLIEEVKSKNGIDKGKNVILTALTPL